MSNFAIKQEAFEGPLPLLLELLQNKKLEITSINLAGIAEDFLNYIEQHQIAPVELADFLLVASRLIYLKSRELLPKETIIEEFEDVSLEEQLRLYQQFVDASKVIAELFSADAYFLRRKQPKIEREVEFSPSENLTAIELDKSFKRLTKRLEPFFSLNETSIEKVKSVEERMSELKDALKTGARHMNFKSIVKGAKNKAEVVVSFLAILELVRRQVLVAQQSEHDIMLSKYGS